MKVVLKEECPYQTTVFRWYGEFIGENFKLQDEHSGRHTERITPQNIYRVEKLLIMYRPIIYRHINEIFKIGTPSVYKNLHHHLKVRSDCLLRLAQNLAPEQKKHCLRWYRKILRSFHSENSSGGVNILITI